MEKLYLQCERKKDRKTKFSSSSSFSASPRRWCPWVSCRLLRVLEWWRRRLFRVWCVWWCTQWWVRLSPLLRLCRCLLWCPSSRLASSVVWWTLRSGSSWCCTSRTGGHPGSLLRAESICSFAATADYTASDCSSSRLVCGSSCGCISIIAVGCIFFPLGRTVSPHQSPRHRPAPAQLAFTAPSTGGPQTHSRSRSWLRHPSGAEPPCQPFPVPVPGPSPVRGPHSSTGPVYHPFRCSSWAPSNNRSWSRAPSPSRSASAARSLSPHSSVEKSRAYFHSSLSARGTGDARLHSRARLPTQSQPSSSGATLLLWSRVCHWTLFQRRYRLGHLTAGGLLLRCLPIPIPVPVHLCRRAVHLVHGAAHGLGDLLMRGFHGESHIRSLLGSQSHPTLLRGCLPRADLLFLKERSVILAPVCLLSLSGWMRAVRRSSPCLTSCLWLPPCALWTSCQRLLRRAARSVVFEQPWRMMTNLLYCIRCLSVELLWISWRISMTGFCHLLRECTPRRSRNCCSIQVSTAGSSTGSRGRTWRKLRQDYEAMRTRTRRTSVGPPPRPRMWRQPWGPLWKPPRGWTGGLSRWSPCR